MTVLADRLEAARAEVARLEREFAQGSCREVGHQWESYGGRNAGCSLACCCSVPVNVCTKCGDCDYGENDEANQTRRECREQSHV